MTLGHCFPCAPVLKKCICRWMRWHVWQWYWDNLWHSGIACQAWLDFSWKHIPSVQTLLIHSMMYEIMRCSPFFISFISDHKMFFPQPSITVSCLERIINIVCMLNHSLTYFYGSFRTNVVIWEATSTSCLSVDLSAQLTLRLICHLQQIQQGDSIQRTKFDNKKLFLTFPLPLPECAWLELHYTSC